MVFRKFKYNLGFFSLLSANELEKNLPQPNNLTEEQKTEQPQALNDCEKNKPTKTERSTTIEIIENENFFFYQYNIQETQPATLKQKQSKQEIKESFLLYQKYFILLLIIFLSTIIYNVYYFTLMELKYQIGSSLIIFLILLFHINHFNNLCEKIATGNITFSLNLVDYYFFVKYVIFITGFILFIMLCFFLLVNSHKFDDLREFLFLFYVGPIFLTYLSINTKHKKQIKILKKIFVLEDEFFQKYKYLYNILDKF